MNTKKLLIATIGQAVITLLIAAPWHFVLFKDTYHSFGIYNRTEPIVPLGFLSMLIQSAIMAYIYPQYVQNKSGYKAAIRFAMLMGLFLYSVSTIANAAKIEVSPMGTWFLLQVGFHLLQFIGVGLVLGFVYTEKKN